MALLVTPTTELEAVNEMLTAIGTHPVESLAVPGLSDASIAIDTLATINREVQGKGWWFNKGYGVSFTPSGNEVAVPSNVISIRPARGSFGVAGESKRFVARQNKLFDLDANSFTINTTVKADVTYLLDFEDLPENARRYITIRAARIFQTKVLGDEQQGVFSEAHEQDAWVTFEDDHIDSTPGSYHFLQRHKKRFGVLQTDPSQTAQPRQRRN